MSNTLTREDGKQITVEYIGDERDLNNRYDNYDSETGYEPLPNLIKWLNEAQSAGATHVEIYCYTSSEDITAHAVKFTIETDEELAARRWKEIVEKINDKKQREADEYNKYLELRAKYEPKND